MLEYLKEAMKTLNEAILSAVSTPQPLYNTNDRICIVAKQNCIDFAGK